MPELPDIELYLAKLRERIQGRRLVAFRVFGLSVLKSVEPKPQDLIGKQVLALSRLGKRIVIGFEDDLFVVIHLMIAGRLRWVDPGGKPLGSKLASAVMEFESGSWFLTEAGSKKRASITIVAGKTNLAVLDPGGAEVQNLSLEAFTKLLKEANQTVKNRLTDPHVLSGIGNAYSDEILFTARVSPLRLSQKLTPEEIQRVYNACRQVLTEWSERLQKQFANRFPGPGDVTAFRPDFAVHGKYGKPCPKCGNPVKRIRYADNEANYCATCQNEGKVLADRAMSRLLK
jgi:formamidopyrimidine-DNA glycosylase